MLYIVFMNTVSQASTSAYIHHDHEFYTYMSVLISEHIHVSLVVRRLKYSFSNEVGASNFISHKTYLSYGL